jgi:hypothetical protein
MLKTRPKQLLGSLLLDIALPAATNALVEVDFFANKYALINVLLLDIYGYYSRALSN